MRKYYIITVIILLSLTLFGCARNAAAVPAQAEQTDQLDTIVQQLTEKTAAVCPTAKELREQTQSNVFNTDHLKSKVLEIHGFGLLCWEQLSPALILDTYKFDPAVMWPSGSTTREMKWGRSYILRYDDVLYIIAYQQYLTKIGMYRVYHFYMRDSDGIVTKFDCLDNQTQLADLAYEIRRYFYSAGEYQVP